MTQSLVSSLVIWLCAPQCMDANIINTTEISQYENEIIQCAPNENCTVICDTYAGCRHANINCPHNYSCNIQCIKSQSCYNTTFNWPNNNDDYSLTCQGGSACRYTTIDAPNNNEDFYFECGDDTMPWTCGHSTINCPTHANCIINCGGKSNGGCARTKINCPTDPNLYCNIKCNGYKACEVSNFTGNGIVSCVEGRTRACYGLKFPTPPPNINYTLHCDSKLQCYRAKIRCPTDADCHIICTGYESCTDATITWPTGSGYQTSITCASNTSCEGLADPPGGAIIYLDNGKGGNIVIEVTVTIKSNITNDTMDEIEQDIANVILEAFDTNSYYSLERIQIDGNTYLITVSISGSNEPKLVAEDDLRTLMTDTLNDKYNGEVVVDDIVIESTYDVQSGDDGNNNIMGVIFGILAGVIVVIVVVLVTIFVYKKKKGKVIDKPINEQVLNSDKNVIEPGADSDSEELYKEQNNIETKGKVTNNVESNHKNSLEDMYNKGTDDVITTKGNTTKGTDV